MRGHQFIIIIIIIISSSSLSSSLAHGPYGLTSASFRLTAHAHLFSGTFPHLLTPVYFTPFLVQSIHLNFGLPAFLHRTKYSLL
jgi:hypothetical protein